MNADKDEMIAETSSSQREPLLKQDSLSTDSMHSTLGNGAHAIASKKSDPLPNFNLLGGMLDLDRTKDELEHGVGRFLRQGSTTGVLLWIFLLIVVFFGSPRESFEYLEGPELYANSIILLLLVCVNCLKLSNLVIRDSSLEYVRTGAIIGSTTIQMIAMLSLSLMVFVPTPVLIDPITGLRCHLIRWVEWTVLAFLMTFMTESIDLPTSQNGSLMAWLHGLALGVSTAAGGLFPFCETFTSWMVVFGTSCLLFSSLYVRLWQRRQNLFSKNALGTIEEQEDYQRAFFSLKIVTVCAVAWTGLVASYIFCCMAPFYLPGTVFASKAFLLLTENFWEAVSKIWYLHLLVEVHKKIFDDATRTARRLEEVRRTMSAVWETSTDVMSMVSRREDRLVGLVSPAFFDLLVGKKKHGVSSDERKSLVIEVHQDERSFRTFEISLSQRVTRSQATQLAWRRIDSESESVKAKNIKVIADLMANVMSSKAREASSIRTLYTVSADGVESDLMCEAKFTRVQKEAFLVVIRDISERFQRFETEKKLIREVTSRRKDAEANRFTRHEVKNGILAAIGLLDSLKDVSQKKGPSLEPSYENQLVDCDQSSHEAADFDECLAELDNTLRDILETIMDHAMSREVIYQEYKVRKERIHVPDILLTIRKHGNWNDSRFPVEVSPYPFPILGLDPRLLRYIYQNAVSNACRYGAPNTKVTTFISYCEESKMFELQVINDPGPGHDYLLSLDPAEVNERVFSPGSRLHKKSEDEEFVTVNNSSGDGAWIMQKCAMTLKGGCELRFDRDRTVFSFKCPARVHAAQQEPFEDPTMLVEMNELPENTWGVVIDDSTIQRKLMDRFLKVAGIPKDKRLIVGKDSQEIYGFCDTVVELVEREKGCRFLVIADENLEVVEGKSMAGTVSGSLSLQKVLERLDPADESRVLALVRSANDSVSDVNLYTSRSHGYLVKAPIDKDGVIGSIKPWWIKRFPIEGQGGSRLSLKRQNSTSSVASDQTYDASGEIWSILDVVDALCSQRGGISSLQKRWKTIQDRLQRLKGDLKTILPSGDDERGHEMARILNEIDRLRSGSMPDDLQVQWVEIRRDISIVLQRGDHRAEAT